MNEVFPLEDMCVSPIRGRNLTVRIMLASKPDTPVKTGGNLYLSALPQSKSIVDCAVCEGSY